MKKLLILAILGLSYAHAQTITPNTTLSAAQSLTQTTLCLTSTTGIVNQAGVYIDAEYELVLLSNSQVVAAGPACFPVSRSNRSGLGPPTPHSNGAIAWVAFTPGGSNTPGTNGFGVGTQYFDVGPCTRGNQTYLPHIFPSTAHKRDCNGGNWVEYSTGNDPVEGGVQVLSTTNGAITVSQGNYIISKAGVLADTLAAPTVTVQDGMIIHISSTTANAHTITATGLLQTGTASVNVATFAAQAGAGLTLMAYNGKWIVLYSVGITFS